MSLKFIGENVTFPIHSLKIWSDKYLVANYNYYTDYAFQDEKESFLLLFREDETDIHFVWEFLSFIMVLREDYESKRMSDKKLMSFIKNSSAFTENQKAILITMLTIGIVSKSSIIDEVKKINDKSDFIKEISSLIVYLRKGE